ncbi:MAG: type II secretion system protein J [Geobacter sp.]
MRHSQKGFTLVEMLIVTVIFILVIMAASSSFNVLLNQMAKLTKSEESNIEGVVGLEMLRHDLQQVGFGLPTAYLDPAPTYIEASVAPADDYNDAPSGVPRAVVAADNLVAGVELEDTVDGVTYALLAGTDYLAVKGITLGMNDTAQKWTYVSLGLTPQLWQDAHLNLVKDDDRVVVIKKTVSNDRSTVSQMIYDPASPGTYWTTFDPAGLPPAFSPIMAQEMFYIYGIRADGNLSMPFNRSDYFIATPDAADRVPTYCAPGTGILYKARVSHDEIATTGYAAGALQPMPLLDCVADMQVVYGWDLVDDDNVIDTWSAPNQKPDGTGLFGAQSGVASQTAVQTAIQSPEEVRAKLKIIKIYLLAQVGRRDRNYTFMGADVAGQPQRIRVGNLDADGFVAHEYDLSAAQRNYRWKVYQLVVRPHNLESNQ